MGMAYLQCPPFQEQIDAMLSGNLSFDTKKEGEDDDEGGANAVEKRQNWLKSAR